MSKSAFSRNARISFRTCHKRRPCAQLPRRSRWRGLCHPSVMRGCTHDNRRVRTCHAHCCSLFASSDWFQSQFRFQPLRWLVVTLHGRGLLTLPFFGVTFPLHGIQFGCTLGEEPAEGIANGQRVEVAVELAVTPQLEASNEVQELRQLDATVTGGKQRGELLQGVHIRTLLGLRCKVKRGQLGLHPQGGRSGRIQAVKVGYDRRLLAVGHLWTG